MSTDLPRKSSRSNGKRWNQGGLVTIEDTEMALKSGAAPSKIAVSLHERWRKQEVVHNEMISTNVNETTARTLNSRCVAK